MISIEFLMENLSIIPNLNLHTFHKQIIVFSTCKYVKKNKIIIYNFHTFSYNNL